MKRLAMETDNITDKNIEKILELFPNVATESRDENGNLKTAIDFEKLKQELSHNVIDGEESYDFTWVGKKEAMLEANRPIRKTLRPDRESSVNWDTTENIYIEGDNLDALKLLQESYMGKIKMIYIDPPYNTGGDFIYRDNFTQDKESYEEELEIKDEEGNKLFQNTESNGRFHSSWCSMMYPRLKLARNLLTDDGVIFISIDDNEVDNLKKICDEVFGESNFVVTIHCQMSTTQGMKIKSAQAGNVVKNAEYILCYSKDGHKNIAKNPLYDPRPKYDEHYTLYLKDDGSIGNILELYDYRFPKDLSNKKTLTISEAYSKSEEFADIVRSHLADIVRSDKIGNIDARELKPGYWKKVNYNDREYLLTLDNKGHIRQLLRLKDSWGKTDDYYQSEGLRKISGDWWEGFYLDMGNISKEGNIEFKNGKKPVRLIKQLVKMVADRDSVILDFFSGSATTAHACMQLNVEDGGNRKFIMVQLPEVCDEKSEAYKTGYKNICQIGEERIRRAGKKIQEENPDKKIDIGFRVFKVDDTNMKDVYYTPNETDQKQLEIFESNIKDDRTDEDLLYGCLLDWGVELSLPHKVEVIDGKRVHIINEQEGFEPDLIACFEDSIPESVIRKIAEKKPTRVVFRDSSFVSDDNKINVEEIFKLITPETKVKVI